LKAYLDGELAAPFRLAMRLHLARCGECREGLRWLQRLGEDMRDLEKATPRPELRARILASLPDAPPSPVAARPAAPRRSSAVYRLPALTAGTGVIMMAVGAFALARHGEAPVRTVVAPISHLRSMTTVAAPGPRQAPHVGLRGESAVSRPVVAAPPRTAAPDPVNDAADRMFAQWKREEEMKARASRQDQPARGAAAPIMLHPEAEVDLVTEDPARARDAVGEIARNLGGKILPVRSLTRRGTIDASADVVAIRIPREKSDLVMGAMQGIGAVSRSEGDGKPEHGPMPWPEYGVAPVTPRPEGPGQGDSSVAPPVRLPTDMSPHASRGVYPAFAPHPDERPAGGRLITVLVRLRRAGGSGR
jgi:hypothetical protein